MSVYRVSHLLVDLGWVDLDFECSTVCQILPGLIMAGQLGKMVEHRNQSHLNQGLRPDGTPCTFAPLRNVPFLMVIARG